MDTDSDMTNTMRDTIKLMELRGHLYDAIDVRALHAVCSALEANVDDAKNDWLTPLGNLMGAVMYILDMHSGMSDDDRRMAASAVAASIITNSMKTESEKADRTVN